jgi:hypothetical protein
MQHFFRTHKCNAACRLLQLTSVKLIEDLEKAKSAVHNGIGSGGARPQAKAAREKWASGSACTADTAGTLPAGGGQKRGCGQRKPTELHSRASASALESSAPSTVNSSHLPSLRARAACFSLGFSLGVNSSHLPSLRARAAHAAAPQTWRKSEVMAGQDLVRACAVRGTSRDVVCLLGSHCDLPGQRAVARAVAEHECRRLAPPRRQVIFGLEPVARW